MNKTGDVLTPYSDQDTVTKLLTEVPTITCINIDLLEQVNISSEFLGMIMTCAWLSVIGAVVY